MEKRPLLVLTLLIGIFLFATSAMAALTVTLTNPADANSNSSSTLIFTCSATANDGMQLSNVTLLIGPSGSLIVNETAAASGTSYDALFTVDNIAEGTHYWICKAASTNNSILIVSERSFTRTGANTAPIFTGTIPNKNFPEDSSLGAFDLDAYFSDLETATLSYSSSGGSNISVGISDGYVTFSSTNNWSGSEVITFNATDGGSLTNTSNAVTVTVDAVDDAPYYSTIPDLNWSKNTNKSIDLDDYFDDVDDSSITYNVSSSPSHMNVTISGSSVVLSPDADWTGATTIKFSASDGSSTTESNTVDLTVYAEASNNSAPVIRCGADTGLVIPLDLNEKWPLKTTSEDPDGDTLTLKWYVDDEVVSGETGDNYEFSESKSGIYVVKAEASDGTDTNSCTFEVNVSDLSGESGTDIDMEGIDIESIMADQTEDIAICGDGIIQDDEDCSNCPEDIICGENEDCTEGICTPKKPSNKKAIIIFLVIITVICGGGFGIYKFITKKTERHMFGEAESLDKPTKEKPAVEVHDIYQKQQSRPVFEPSAPKRPKTLKETPLQVYVRGMKEKGFKDKEIMEKLKSQGWSEEDLKSVLK